MTTPPAPVRDIGTVRDVHGYVIRVGVDHDSVTIRGSAYAMLGPDVIDDFVRLVFTADEDAKAWARAHDEDEAREAQDAGFPVAPPGQIESEVAADVHRLTGKG